MICPACKNEMLVVEYDNIELDYCNNCYGVWFDSTELELLLKSMSLDSRNLLLNDILNAPEAVSPEKKWFDGGEVAQLLKHLSSKQPAGQGSQQQIISFLGEVFKAQAKVPK
jgi:Zn-finger nucleic acid-binding protein